MVTVTIQHIRSFGVPHHNALTPTMFILTFWCIIDVIWETFGMGNPWLSWNTPKMGLAALEALIYWD